MIFSNSSRWLGTLLAATIVATLPIWPHGVSAQVSESISPAFGKALAGGMIVEGKPEYRLRPITVECRARLNGAAAFNILVASDPKDSSEHWELYSFAGTGEFCVFQTGRGGDFHSNFNICDAKWHQLSAYLGEDVVKLYVDGKKVFERATSPVSGDPDPGDLAFGRLVEGGFGCDGLIDDVRISRGEIPVVVSDKPAVANAETIGLWNFDNLPSAADNPAASASASAAAPAPTPDNRASLPEYQTIPAASTSELTPANGWPAMSSYKDWTRSLGGPTCNRYSTLDQINRSNVANLQVAWTYHSKDGQANIQCNPIIVGDTMYLPTAGNAIAAVNAATGVERWKWKPADTGVMSMESVPARRGLLYWPGAGDVSARLIVGMGGGIYAIDPKTGQLIPSFGKQGRTALPPGATAAGAVYKNVLVIPGYTQDVFGYDVGTGKMLWRFRTVPVAGEFGADTWKGPEHFGANDWGGMAMDESRGIAYVATGSPKPNYVGIKHLGDNLFANCVIAINAETGKRLWDFQEIRHDIWDMDIPAPPNLVTVMHDGKRVDAVAQVTKQGNTLLLDRVTGKPLFPFRRRRAPASNLPGEVTATYQPDLELPQPFAKEEYTRDDITNISPKAHAYIEGLLANAVMGFFTPIEEHKPLAYFGVHGGAEWTGAAFDPTSGRLFVSTNHMPWLITAIRDHDAVASTGQPGDQVAASQAVPTAGGKVYLQYCAACHGKDLAGQGMIPSLRDIGNRLKESQVMEISKNGRNSMPPPAPMSDDQRKSLMDFLFERDRAPQTAAINPKLPANYSFNGYNKLLDQDEYPGTKPPWGTLDCIDLNTGKRPGACRSASIPS